MKAGSRKKANWIHLFNSSSSRCTYNWLVEIYLMTDGLTRPAMPKKGLFLALSTLSLMIVEEITPITDLSSPISVESFGKFS